MNTQQPVDSLLAAPASVLDAYLNSVVERGRTAAEAADDTERERMHREAVALGGRNG